MTRLCVDYTISILSLTVIQDHDPISGYSLCVSYKQSSLGSETSLGFLIRTEAKEEDEDTIQKCVVRVRVERKKNKEDRGRGPAFITAPTIEWICGWMPGKAWEFVSCSSSVTAGSNKMGSCVVWNLIDIVELWKDIKNLYLMVTGNLADR